MITYNIETPVLLIVQEHFEIIQNIYNELLHVKPKRLYLFFMGWEDENEKENQEHIQSIFKEITWECNVKTIYNKKRLQYNKAMQKALQWFFHREAEGIILDGFNVPFPAFFAFCSYMLEKYRNDQRIGYICGQDMLKSEEKSKTNDSYYFSRLIQRTSVWASWRRVWQDMNSQIKTFSAFKKLNIIEDIPTLKPFKYIWSLVNQNELNWDARYEYINLINNRLAIIPNILQLPVNEYELPEINHPVFMVNPLSRELQYQEKKYDITVFASNKPDGLTFLRDRLFSFSKEAGHQLKIPRIIHQIYEDPAGPPANLHAIAESWKEKMPDWEYRFWNRQKINDFLKSTCPDFLNYYRSYPFDVQRWDAIRYLILYHIGGLYADFDYECIQPLDVLLSGTTCCMGMEPALHNLPYYDNLLLVGNALMASEPKHPYMAAIIEDMKTNVSVDYHKGDSMYVMETTGPLMVTRVYNQFKKKKKVTLLSADCVAPLTMPEVCLLRTNHVSTEMKEKISKAFAIHYFFGSWLQQTSDNKNTQ